MPSRRIAGRAFLKPGIYIPGGRYLPAPGFEQRQTNALPTVYREGIFDLRSAFCILQLPLPFLFFAAA